MYQLNEEQRSNLLIFLNRLEYKGLKEVEAINNILIALAPNKENENIDKS